MRAGPWDAVRNLTTYTARVQEVDVDVREGERVVVVMWHCHVALDEALACLTFGGRRWGEVERVRERVAIVLCSCCNYADVQKALPGGTRADFEFEEIGVPGLMRTVRVWKYVEG